MGPFITILSSHFLKLLPKIFSYIPKGLFLKVSLPKKLLTAGSVIAIPMKNLIVLPLSRHMKSISDMSDLLDILKIEFEPSIITEVSDISTLAPRDFIQSIVAFISSE